MRKPLMNCDQVFEVLTRGPFPTGQAGDDDVERHLRACHECRQLAEALQPAVELLHESLDPAQNADLPEYQGVLAVVESSVATADGPRPRPLSVRQLARLRVAERRQFALSYFTQFAVAAVLLMAIGMLGWNLITTAREANGDSRLIAAMLAPGGGRAVTRLDDRGLVTLTSLNLPSKCFPGGALIDTTGGEHSGAATAAAPAAMSRSELHCCLDCHGPGKASRPVGRTIAAMQNSCVACHRL
jgi:hypothetical protein